METYDPSIIGERIAWGRTHSVYRYGDGEVIRFPRLERWLWGANLQRRYERDIAICRRYFGDYFLDTRIVYDPESGALATIQPYISGRYLSKTDLHDARIRTAFEDFLSRHEALIRDGYAPLDLAGQGGIVRRRLSNVMVLRDRSIRLFDAVILDLGDLTRGRFLDPRFKDLLIWWQNRTIRYLRS